MGRLILLAFAVFVFWAIRRDTARREGISPALWIPTLWLGIIASRSLSAWIGFGGASDTLEGSPLDRVFYLVMIALALFTLSRRRIQWSQVLSSAWPVLLFYGYLLVSVLWANQPDVSFKRWIKESGNILMALVILTDEQPLLAIRAVFVRCAYALIPLSVIFIRYFPDLGRRYNVFSGGMEATGVTFQKNTLGTMVFVCTLILIWDWWERGNDTIKVGKFERWIAPAVLVASAYLLRISDSKTSIVCLLIGTVILAAVRFPQLRSKVSFLGRYFLGVIVTFSLVEWMFGIVGMLVKSMGRDLTFTGRTDVWRELLRVHEDPVFGTGFMSFWDDAHYRSRLPSWVAFSAHNGYLDIYLAGGFIGVFFLVLMLLSTGAKINRQLQRQESYAVVRFAVFAMVLIANFTESNFACMTPLGLLFLVSAISPPDVVRTPVLQSEAWEPIDARGLGEQPPAVE